MLPFFAAHVGLITLAPCAVYGTNYPLKAVLSYRGETTQGRGDAVERSIETSMPSAIWPAVGIGTMVFAGHGRGSRVRHYHSRRTWDKEDGEQGVHGKTCAPDHHEHVRGVLGVLCWS